MLATRQRRVGIARAGKEDSAGERFHCGWEKQLDQQFPPIGSYPGKVTSDLSQFKIAVSDWGALLVLTRQVLGKNDVFCFGTELALKMF